MKNLPLMLFRLVSAVVVLAIFGTSCGDDTSITADVPSTTTITLPDGSTVDVALEGDRGWLEGDDLDWSGFGEEGAVDAEFEATADYASAGDEELRAFEAPAEGPDAEGVIIEPLPSIDDSPLSAGSINDRADIDRYLEYRQSVMDSGVAVRPLDLSDPTLITVVGDDGRPVLDADVQISNPAADSSGPALTLRTTADGTVMFFPHAHGVADFGAFAVTIGGVASSPWPIFDLGEPTLDITVDGPGGIDGSVLVDVHFLLDATGSMGDEIARLRDNMASIAERIDSLPSQPDVRFGMTVYRDEGDLFVTRTFDLTDDLDAFLVALDDVVADGGGDYPEALDEALADGLFKPAWRRDGAVELLVLIADAPPQVGRQVELPYTDAAIQAASLGVKILPVAASGTDDQAEYVFRELAFVTGGRFVFLSYGVDGSGGTATGEGSDISTDDYDELPLDELVIRLVEDEVLALTGGDRVTTTTTVPRHDHHVRAVTPDARPDSHP